MSQKFIAELPLSSSEIIYPNSPFYRPESSTWALQKDLKPKIIARPCTPSSLAALLSFLSNSNLDWAVRSTGVGSSSASDVLISLSAFDQFEYNAEDQTVIIGAGQSWGQVDRKIEESAPGHAVQKVKRQPQWLALVAHTLELAGPFLQVEYRGCLLKKVLLPTRTTC
ncbi:uncharacterized protein N7479_007945 [Penicillium vulpinum]|uniref:uncharacterized protein n=1 Tax=Penicillium vulpinum TaxID=29845 RepID=UPI002549574D|nr:uncharacterized protein N7479_007945 [Penicillium vulpinum]KAJ5960795.1 hypothetical protein N7479_007945 [Penicillium vulpinum]